MNYYVGIMETVNKEKDKEIRTEHIDYLNRLIEEGKIFAKGPFSDGSGGLIIFNVNSYEEAKELADNDPVSIEKTRKFVLHEWKSSLE
jgi:uncharacterized protein YciI